MLPNTSRMRFNCVSSPPPALRSVVESLTKAARSEPGTPKSNLWGLIKRADRTYDEAGPNDDTQRFLVQTGILHYDPRDKRYYFDAAQAETVLDCVARKRYPEPQPENRMARIDEIVRVWRAKKSAGRLEVEPEMVDAAADVDEPPQVAEIEALEEPTVEEEDVSLSETEASTEGPSRIFYLTPTEQLVLLAMQADTERVDGQTVLMIPTDDAALAAKLGQRDDYRHAISRFVAVGALRPLGYGRDGSEPHAVSWSRHHIVRNITLRETVEIERVYVEIFARITRLDPFVGKVFPSTSELRKWAISEHPDINVGTLMNKVVGYRPEGRCARTQGFGLVDRQGPRLLVCAPGFEPYMFAAIDREPVRYARNRHQRVLEAEPDLPPDPVPPPEPPPPPSRKPEIVFTAEGLGKLDDAKLKSVEGALQSQIAEAQERLELVQGELAERDRARNANLRRRREELTRELAEIDGQLGNR